MKTLLVDVDQAMLQHCVNRIKGRQQIAIAASKAQALFMLRHSPGFHAVVACERLEDGSGLALLADIHIKWPNMIRVFSTEPARLAVVRERLSAFHLRHTLPYPLKPAKLELMLVHLAHARARAMVRPRGPRSED